MNVSEGFRESWDMIRHNKLRTLLTMLGMNIGVAAVVAIMASGMMARSAIMSGVETIGASFVWISPNREIYEDRAEVVRLKPEDVGALEALVPDALYSPFLVGNLQMSYRGFERSVRIFGVVPEYLQIWGNKLAYGRFVEEADVEDRGKVAVLGIGTARAFFDDEELAIGKQVRIGQQVFTVSGVMAKRERSFIGDSSNDDTVYLPYSTYEKLTNWDRYGGPRVRSINIQVNDIGKLDYTVAVFDRYLLARYGAHNGEPRFVVHRAEENIETFNKIFKIITTVISLIAGISLLVSGIGIMNIMLVAVTERVREIGVRKALGAKRIDIMMQFAIEAIIVCLVGGGIGVILGVIIATVVALSQGWIYIMPFYAIGLGLGVSATIGMFFGSYPAVKASRLDPVVALARE